VKVSLITNNLKVNGSISMLVKVHFGLLIYTMKSIRDLVLMVRMKLHTWVTLGKELEELNNSFLPLKKVLSGLSILKMMFGFSFMVKSLNKPTLKISMKAGP